MTGNQEFHPVYMSLGNVHNDMRRAHRDAVIPIAFLSIPKGESSAPLGVSTLQDAGLTTTI